jgi:hypothetical protein
MQFMVTGITSSDPINPSTQVFCDARTVVDVSCYTAFHDIADVRKFFVQGKLYALWGDVNDCHVLVELKERARLSADLGVYHNSAHSPPSAPSEHTKA